MQNSKTEGLNNELIRMLEVANFGLKPLVESTTDSNTTNLKEEEDLNIGDIFDDPNSKDKEKKAETDTTFDLPIELKAAMLATNMTQYQAQLLNLYTHYEPFTRGTQVKTGGEAGDKKFVDDKSTLVDKPSVEKFKGAADLYQQTMNTNVDPMAHTKGRKYDAEWNEIIKKRRVPITYHDGHLETREMTDDEKKATARWLTNKTYEMISYTSSGGLTPMGKAQLEFLARVYRNQPADEKETLLFKFLENSARRVAKTVLIGFYEKVMIPIIMNVTKRAKYNPNDFQLESFIEQGVSYAVGQLISEYNPQRGNVGTFIMTTATNFIINLLKRISTYKVNQDSFDYLMNFSGPFKAYSAANPEEVTGNYDSVVKVKEGGEQKGKGKARTIYAYVYNDASNALADLNRDARVDKGKPSPLSLAYIVNPTRSLLYKSIGAHPDDIKAGMNIPDENNPGEEENVITFTGMPEEAKKVVVAIIDDILNGILANPAAKTYHAFIGKNRVFVRNLMYNLLQIGQMVEVYKRAWTVKNEKGGITKAPVGSAVKMTTDENGNKNYMPNTEGEMPTENDVTWVWSSGNISTDTVFEDFINRFMEKMSKYQTPDGSKSIPDKFQNPKDARTITSAFLGLLRKYFGYEGANAPAVAKNRKQLDDLLKTYSVSAVNYEYLEEMRKAIRNILQKIIK